MLSREFQIWCEIIWTSTSLMTDKVEGNYQIVQIAQIAHTLIKQHQIVIIVNTINNKLSFIRMLWHFMVHKWMHFSYSWPGEWIELVETGLLTVIAKINAKRIQELLRSNKEAQMTIIHVCCSLAGFQIIESHHPWLLVTIIGIHFFHIRIILDTTSESHLTVTSMQSFQLAGILHKFFLIMK